MEITMHSLARRLTYLVGIVSSVWMSGCATPIKAGPVDSLAQNESVLVFGVNSLALRVVFEEAEVKDGGVDISPFRRIAVSMQPTDGHVVVKLPGGTTLALSEVVSVSSTGGAARRLGYVCGGARAAVVTLPPGKVLYFGHVDVTGGTARSVSNTIERGNVRLSTTNEFAKAHTHLQKNHQGIAERLEPATVASLPMKRSC
jgi:hypothetical protein